MAKNKRQRAKKLAIRGASASQIRRKTGVSKQAAKKFVARQQTKSNRVSQPAQTPVFNSAGDQVRQQPTEAPRQELLNKIMASPTTTENVQYQWVPGLLQPGQKGYNAASGGGAWVFGQGKNDPAALRAYFKHGVTQDKAFDGTGLNRSDYTFKGMYGGDHTNDIYTANKDGTGRAFDYEAFARGESPTAQDMAISAAQEKARGGKRKGGGLRKQIKAAGPNISRSEFNDILRSAGGNVAKVLNRISNVGSNLNSGAANMLTKQLQESPFAFGRKGLGDSKIARTIQQMAGTPDFRSAKMRQMGLGPGATPGTGMMIGGTVIRPGGKIAVKKAARTPVTTGLNPVEPEDTDVVPDGTEYSDDYGLDLGSFLDQLTGGGLTPPQTLEVAEVPELPDFEELFADLNASTPNPLQLAALGKAYGGEMIRARRRPRRSRSSYLRNPMSGMLSAAPEIIAPLMIGGGVTL